MRDHPIPGAANQFNLFTTVQAPRLTAIYQKVVKTFLAESDSYEAAVAAQPGINAYTYRMHFNSIFLRSLVQARVFTKDTKDISELKDVIIKKKLLELSSGIR